MIKYVIQDLVQTIRYLPFFLMIWLLLLVVVYLMNKKREKAGKNEWPILSIVNFGAYLALVIMITFWSRESGSLMKIDLQIGSSLRINNRNNALVMENVLLFIPYGFFMERLRKKKSTFIENVFIGFVTSFAIEALQLVTGRGIFQLDDILTNTIGCIVGVFACKCLKKFFGK